MRSLIASIITASAVLPMFWMDVVPTGKEICSSPVEFNTILNTAAQKQAASTAKVKFCSVVETKI